jgi:hypothetical protein
MYCAIGVRLRPLKVLILPLNGRKKYLARMNTDEPDRGEAPDPVHLPMALDG